jgi:hypothetical protein
MRNLSDDAVRAIWRRAGGRFSGPNIEHGSMPEEKLLPFIRALCVVDVVERTEHYIKTRGLDNSVAGTVIETFASWLFYENIQSEKPVRGSRCEKLIESLRGKDVDSAAVEAAWIMLASELESKLNHIKRML